MEPCELIFLKYIIFHKIDINAVFISMFNKFTAEKGTFNNIYDVPIAFNNIYLVSFISVIYVLLHNVTIFYYIFIILFFNDCLILGYL